MRILGRLQSFFQSPRSSHPKLVTQENRSNVQHFQRVSLWRQHTSCSSQVISASGSIAHLLHYARMPGILEHPCESWLWNVPKIQTLAAQPRTAWALADFCVLNLHAGSERWFWLGMWTTEICAVLLANVLGHVDVTVFQAKHVHPKASLSRSECYSSRDHTHPPRSSFALAMIVTMHARRLQRTHPLSGAGSSLNASKDMTLGSYCPCACCESEPVIDVMYIAVVGSARTGRVLDAGSNREDRSSDVCNVVDTR